MPEEENPDPWCTDAPLPPEVILVQAEITEEDES